MNSKKKLLQQKLFELRYLNPLWPSELIENAKDPDYLNINFSKSDSGITVELTFRDNNQIIASKYWFDDKDFLQRAIMIEGDSESTMFDRNKEMQHILLELNEGHHSNNDVAETFIS